MATVIDLEQKIGIPAWGSYSISPSEVQNATTSDLVEWATLRGMPRNKAITISRATLEKCYYTSKNYFDTVAGNRPKSVGNSTVTTRRSKYVDVMDVLNGKVEGQEAEPQEKITSEIQDDTPDLFQNPPLSATPRSPMDVVREQDLQQQIQQAVRNFIVQTRPDIVRDAVREITGTFNPQIAKIPGEIATQIESGKLKVNFGPGLEKKILDVVRDTADEVVFQTLRNRKQEKQEDGEQEQPQDPQILPTHSSAYVPEIEPDFYMDPFPTRVIRTAITRGKNTFISGQTGCGKTALAAQVCATMNRGMVRVNPHDGITKESLIGGMSLRPGETYWQDGELPRAMRLGLVFLLDEGDYLAPNLAAVFNPVTERGGRLHIPETGETIIPAPGFCVIVTANTGGKGDNLGQYTGTEILNTAWLDRFAFKITMDYIPADKEKEMLEKRFPGAMKEEVNQLVALATEIRKAFAAGELSITLSTRKLIDYFDHRTKDNYTQTQALGLCFLNWLDEDDRTLVKTFLDRLQIVLEE